MPETQSNSNDVPIADSHAPVVRGPSDLAKLSLGALGVVYGDIGTSPLYAIKECFLEGHGVEATLANVLGVLSLVFWALLLVIVVKYATFVLRADNHGDGGILALLALLLAGRASGKSGRSGVGRPLFLIALGLIGASLLLGEGMITPAISVLGALEGLDVATVFFRPAVVPLAVTILVALFLLQKRGTAGIGVLFGPVMMLWFATIAIFGVMSIARFPEVLAAVNPIHGARFFARNGLHGFLILGSVVLCVTGGEALFADLGHFGKLPIRFAWYSFVLPSLLLNYFGQGALLAATGGEGIDNPFFSLAPQPLLYPLVALATAAAVIASQAMISGAFSLAQQAVQLGFLPRLTIVHTSEEARGQIYVPEINNLLMVACITLVLAFRASSNLAAAYGISVMGTMMCTSVLLANVARRRWMWSWPVALAMMTAFLAIEVPFFTANLPKIAHGGWVPIAFGSVLFLVMTTWARGREILRDNQQKESMPLDSFLAEVERAKPYRVDGTAVFMASSSGMVPPALLHHFKHNKTLHKQVVILTVVTEAQPTVPPSQRSEVEELGFGFWTLVAHYGFMETPRVPDVLRLARKQGLEVEARAASYFLGRETLLTTGRARMARWRKRLFAMLSRNARPANAFFQLPPNRVIELGAQIEL